MTTTRTRAAAAVSLALAAGALPLGGVAYAAAPPAQITSMHPEDNGVFQVARIAPETKGGKERWRVRAHFFVKNTGTRTIKLSKLSIGYPGGAPPAWTKTVADTDDDPAVDSREIAPGKTGGPFTLEDGMAAKGGTFGKRSLFFPVPREIRMTLAFEGYDQRVVYRKPLAVWKSTAQPNGYLFPAKSADLKAGEAWTAGIHAMSRDQKFGYDFGVSRWDATAKKWTGLKPGTDGTKNTDYLIFGKPVYSMAAGTVVKCTWSKPDNPKPGVKLPGSNNLLIHHGNGEYALYAHLKAGSVNPAYCPKDVEEDTYGLNIPVPAGAKLGQAGNSGASDGPHLHVHLALGANGKAFSGEKATGRPLYFRSTRAAGGFDNVSIGAGPFAFNVLAGQMPAMPFNVIKPGTAVVLG